MRTISLFLTVVTATVSIIAPIPAGAGEGHYLLTGTIPVATIPLGGKPEFAQADGGRLFVNIEDRNDVAVIDTARHEVVARWPIAPGEGASGMAIDLKNHRLFLGADKLMVMLDDTTGKVVDSVPIGDGVDACSFDPVSQLAFASCGDGTTTIARLESPDKLVLVQTLKTARGSRTMTIDPMTHKIYLAAADLEPATANQRRPASVPGSFKVLVFAPEHGAASQLRK